MVLGLFLFFSTSESGHRVISGRIPLAFQPQVPPEQPRPGRGSPTLSWHDGMTCSLAVGLRLVSLRSTNDSRTPLGEDEQE